MQENCHHTTITYRASTGPEQGFPCVVFPPREKPVFIVGFPVDENRFFPVENTTQGKPCFYYRDGFAVQIKIFLLQKKDDIWRYKSCFEDKKNRTCVTRILTSINVPILHMNF